MEFPLNYQAGIVSDDTILARGGRYVDANMVRFVRADGAQQSKPQLVGGWERLIREDITGVCRTAFAWVDNSARLNIAFGTEQKLYIWRGGEMFDITPYGPPVRLATDPFAVTNASAVVTVTHTAHGYTTGTAIKTSGAIAGGGITVEGGPFTITVVNANSYTFTFTSPASSTDATTGGDEVVIVPQTVLPAGQVNGTGTSGYSTGAYGVGGYGQPSDDDYFPRTWSFGTLGEALVASPRDGAMYAWANDIAVRAEVVPEAPLRNAFVLTTPERIVMALGTEEEAAPHVYNTRCIRHCDPRIVLDDGREGFRVWTTDSNTLAREKILEGAGRLVSGRVAGPNIFLWTDNELYEAGYVGALDEVYSFTRRGEDCGLIGPNAVTIKNTRAFWLSPDIQFMTAVLGSEPASTDCPHRAELRKYLAPSQRDKIVMSTLNSFGECWLFYPDSRDGLENSRALLFSPAEGWWSKAQLARTAFVDAGPADFPIGVTSAGRIYWHERGRSADGNAISWSLSAGPQFIDSGHQALLIRSFWPDFKDQEGAISLTISTREKPQSTPVDDGPYMIESTTESIPLHTDGRIVSWSISGSSGPAFWRMGNPIVEGRTTRRAK